METKTTNIGNIFNNNCISMMLDYVGDDDAELMEQIRVEVSCDDYGTPYVLAEDVMTLLSLMAKKMQNCPLQNLYISDAYNY